MSKCYSKFTYGFVASAALFVAGGAFAQCDSNSGGDFTDTEFDSGADCSPSAGVDDNGGWNQLDANGDYMYLSAGSYNPGDSFRVKGVVGTYNSPCATAEILTPAILIGFYSKSPLRAMSPSP